MGQVGYEGAAAAYAGSAAAQGHAPDRNSGRSAVSAGSGTDGPRLLGRRHECEVLDRVVSDVLGGRSRLIVVRGEAGVGKSALLSYLSARADECHVASAVGVESEMELAYSGLHQLCKPMLDHLDALPGPQRDVLANVFGLSSGPAPDRFLVGLATLTLFADVAEQQPLVCIVDDVQWLDYTSVQILGFVGRRLLAERVALVCAARTGIGDDVLAGLPQMAVGGLGDSEARALLLDNVYGPLDAAVCSQIVAESHGNPLALLELPRTWNAAKLAGGFGLPDSQPLGSRIEQSYAQRLHQLPSDTQLLVLAAAAEPLGDPVLLHRAAEALGLEPAAADPAVAAGLITVGARVEFAHPLVRSAAYRSAAPNDRHRAHLALAEATNAEADPDRRAWHRARATPRADEEVAAELEWSAGRAQTRGGLAAAAAFLERAAGLTPEPARRAQRELSAAWAKRDAGALDAALALLASVEAGPADPLRAAEIAHLRGKIAFDGGHSADAALLLLGAARRLEPLDAGLARETHLDALAAGIWASGSETPDVLAGTAEAARAAPAAPDPPRVVDLVLDALATRLTDGYAAAAPRLTRALQEIRSLDVDAEDVGRSLGLGGNRVSSIIATEVWDFEAGRALAQRQVRLARDSGALVQLQFALNVLANSEMLAGDFASAAALIEEDRAVAEATGNPPIAYSAMLLAAFHGHEDVAAELIHRARDEARLLGEGRIVTFADYASAVLNNGLGRHDVARDAARRVFEREVVGGYQILAVAEMAEAASRTGDQALGTVAAARLAERVRVTPTDWAVGVASRAEAFLSGGAAADDLYRCSIERLGRAGLRVEVARSHLLYGEWLRRDGRRVDAREQLRTAHDMLNAMGLEAFSERARRELVATGERVRKRTPDSRENLTAQEFLIAQLARDGLSNPEIGTRLFLSPRTVEWHLGKVFTKLGVSSRKQLADSLLDAARAQEVDVSGPVFETATR